MGLGGILAGAGISAVGSILGGRESAKGAEEAIDFERATQRQLRPYIDAGKSALPRYEAGIDDIPDMESLLSYVQRDPGLQFQMQEGINAIEGSAAARGNLLSGNTLKELLRYGQGVASQGIDTALNRNLTLQGTRQNQLATLLQGGLSAAGRTSQLPQLALAGGQARSDMFTNLANTGTNALSNYTFMDLMKRAGAGGFAGYAGGTPYAGGNIDPAVIGLS